MEKSPRVYLSIAGDGNKFRVIANVIMMAETFAGDETTEECIEDSLSDYGLDVTPENIEKVKSFFPADRVWERKSIPAEPELAVAK